MRFETHHREVVARLEREGWIVIRNNGGHTIYGKAGFRPNPVPRHRELSPGVARSIAKVAGWDRR